jgi:hypothetical protein
MTREAYLANRCSKKEALKIKIVNSEPWTNPNHLWRKSDKFKTKKK